jgi:hypothetical protein
MSFVLKCVTSILISTSHLRLSILVASTVNVFQSEFLLACIYIVPHLVLECEMFPKTGNYLQT